MIYMLHKVHPDPPVRGNPNWNTPTQLRRAIEAVDGRVIPLSRYVDLTPEGQAGFAVLTFDDMYENVYEHALPVLREFGVPFEMFVPWGHVGQWNTFDQVKEPPTRFASWTQLWEMSRSGGTIHSHGFWHCDLTLLSKEALAWEVSNPLRCRYFAYPYGKYDERVREAVKAAGYEAALSVHQTDGDQWSLTREYVR